MMEKAELREVKETTLKKLLVVKDYAVRLANKVPKVKEEIKAKKDLLERQDLKEFLDHPDSKDLQDWMAMKDRKAVMENQERTRNIGKLEN